MTVKTPPKHAARPAQALAAGIVRKGPDAVPATARSTDQLIAGFAAEQKAHVEELINRLFREIRDARPAWRQAWPSTEALESSKVTWIKALLEGGISDWENQVELGLRRLRAEPSDFVPAPGKFVEWCAPTAESLGLPAPEAAYAEACRYAHPSSRHGATWSHAAVYEAAVSVGLDVLMQVSGSESWKLFARAYAVMVGRVMSGQALGDSVPLGIGHDSQKPLAQLAEEHSLQFALRLREAQGVPENGAAARAALLARMGLAR